MPLARWMIPSAKRVEVAGKCWNGRIGAVKLCMPAGWGRIGGISRRHTPCAVGRVNGTRSVPTTIRYISMNDHASSDEMRAQLDDFRTDFNRLRDEVSKVIVGHLEILDD